MANSLDWEHGPIPIDRRQPLYKVAAVWINFVFVPVFINFAYSLGTRMPLPSLVAAFIAGGAVLAICSTVSGIIGQRTGLSAGLLVSRVFGKTGGAIVAIAIPLLLIGWDSFSLDLVGTESVRVFGHPELRWLYIVAFMALFATTATAGFRWLVPMSIISIPVMITLMLVGLRVAVQSGGTLPPVTTQESFASAITKVVGLFALGSTLCSPDIQRFCRSTRDAILVGVYTFLIALPFLLIVGGLTALLTRQDSLIGSFAALGLLGLGFTNFIILSWSSCDNDYYSAALGVAAVTGRAKSTLVPPIAFVAACIAILGIGSYLEPWLVAMTTISIPIAGVFIADGLKGPLTRSESRLPQSHIRLTAVISWIIGAAVSYTSTKLQIGIPPLHGIVAAMFVQLLLLSRTSQRPQFT